MRKAFPLRIDERVLDALRAWAADELRSVNAQIEYLLVQALDESGRRPKRRPRGEDPYPPGGGGPVSGDPPAGSPG